MLLDQESGFRIVICGKWTSDLPDRYKIEMEAVRRSHVLRRTGNGAERGEGS